MISVRDFLYSFRASGLFIGTVIGAGFATGEEIKLYFTGCGDGSILLSAFIFAVMSLIFLFFGKTTPVKLWKPLEIISRIVRFFVIGLSFFAMCSAGEELIERAFGIKFGGLMLLTACMFFAEKESKFLAGINAVIVPVIAVFVITVFIGAETDVLTLNRAVFAPSFLYAAMNIFGGGIMLKKLGKDMNVKQAVISSIITFVIIFVLMLCIKKSVEHNFSSMPLIGVAKENGMEIIAVVVVLLAIFTTMLSDVSIMIPELKSVFKSDILYYTVLYLTALISGIATFTGVVENCYPMIGYCGVVYTIYAAISLFTRGFLFYKGNNGVHSACKGAKDDGATHNEIEFKNLTAVNYKKSKPCS